MSHAYSVRPQGLGGPVRIVEEKAAEGAALTFLEDWAPADEAQAAVIVRDLETGREHCFRVDLHTGEAEPCG